MIQMRVYYLDHYDDLKKHQVQLLQLRAARELINDSISIYRVKFTSQG